MTDQELRELDAWIAEHVFGATRAIDKGFACGDCDDRHTVRFNKDEGWTACPLYTTDPAAAMQVLERCAEKLGFLPDIKKSRIGYAWIYGGAASNADTLPLAICLFAKRLFGGAK